MKRALIGNGGHAREVMSLMCKDLVCFVDDAYIKNASDNILPLSKFDPNEWEVMIAIGDSYLRNEMYKKLPPETKYFSFVHPTAVLMKNCFIGQGSFIGAYSILTCDIEIGSHAILNRGVQIGHDCKIGDFFSAMPGSVVSGNVTLFNRVYLGTNSSIREKISVCNDVTIGLNSGVVKNIYIPGTYAGSPARKLIERF